ncbi:MAG: DUF4189 domain-containing protein [Rhodospirillales bacterium]|nr:DUF4189 domain-containing protein [Rhodospirillales bacterium]
MRYAVAVLCGLAPAAIGLSLALVAAPARADNFESCQIQCDRAWGPNGSQDQSCMSQCQSNSGHGASQSYGAIAYGPTSGRWGQSYHWGTKAGAERAALRSCASNDCRVLTWFNRECGALAGDPASGALGYDSGATARQAEASALRYCASSGGKACQLLVHTCSF